LGSYTSNFLKNSKKFITYSYNTQIMHILVCWNPLENGEETHNFFCHLNNNK
jgi:hypothetical protein